MLEQKVHRKFTGCSFLKRVSGAVLTSGLPDDNDCPRNQALGFVISESMTLREHTFEHVFLGHQVLVALYPVPAYNLRKESGSFNKSNHCLRNCWS